MEIESSLAKLSSKNEYFHTALDRLKSCVVPAMHVHQVFTQTSLAYSVFYIFLISRCISTYILLAFLLLLALLQTDSLDFINQLYMYV